MKADPNLVPFRKEWEDNLGGMANAIFWLEKNWPTMLNAQGDRLMDDGTRWIWNYSPINRLLMVEIPGSKKSYEITKERIVEITDRNRDMATYYRPFFEARAYGVNTHSVFGEPIVSWLRTRFVQIIKDHHPDHTPLYLHTAISTLYLRLCNKCCPVFPNIDFGGMLVANEREYEHQVMNSAQVKAYAALNSHLNMMSTTSGVFEEHHMHSYRAVVHLIRQFNHMVNSGDNPLSDFNMEMDLSTRTFLNNEMNRLVKKGLPQDAALVDAIAFNRSYGESLVKTQAMVEALGGETNVKEQDTLRVQHDSNIRDGNIQRNENRQSAKERKSDD